MPLTTSKYSSATGRAGTLERATSDGKGAYVAFLLPNKAPAATFEKKPVVRLSSDDVRSPASVAPQAPSARAHMRRAFDRWWSKDNGEALSCLKAVLAAGGTNLFFERCHQSFPFDVAVACDDVESFAFLMDHSPWEDASADHYVKLVGLLCDAKAGACAVHFGKSLRSKHALPPAAWRVLYRTSSAEVVRGILGSMPIMCRRHCGPEDFWSWEMTVVAMRTLWQARKPEPDLSSNPS